MESPGSMDPLARLAQMRKQRQSDMNFKILAPVGKKIICEVQRRQLYNLEVQIDRRSMDSTLSSINQNTSQSSEMSYLEPETPTKTQGKTRNQVLKERYLNGQARWKQAELALGGPHNIFKDPAPQFKAVLLDASADEESDEERVAAGHDEVDSMEILTSAGPSAGSQGRVGEGCSTPRLANVTMAPLRQIDVSAVVRLDDSNSNRQCLVEFPPLNLGCAGGGSKRPDNQLFHVDIQNKNLPEEEDEPAEQMEVDDVVDVVVVANTSQQGNNETLDMFRPADRRKTFVVPKTSQQAASSSSHPEGTFTIDKGDGASSSASAGGGGTFTVNNDAGGEAANGTFVIAAENQQPSSSGASNATFTRPEMPSAVADQKKERRSNTKVTLDERENRFARAAEKEVPPVAAAAEVRKPRGPTKTSKSSSLLTSMFDVTVESPGRALFAGASRPTKLSKVSTTPVRTEQQQQVIGRPSMGDMSMDIRFEDISQPAADFSMADDSSMVDPLTDPRAITPMADATTPKRTPGVRPKSRLHRPAEALDEPAVVTNTNTPATRTPANTSVPSVAVTTPIERVCTKQQTPASVHQGTPRPLPSYMRPTVSSARRTGASRISATVSPAVPLDVTEPSEDSLAISPFLPIDPNRMIVTVTQSGARPRVPPARLQVNQRLQQRLLFGDDSLDADSFAESRRERMMSRADVSARPQEVASNAAPAPVVQEEEGGEASQRPATELDDEPHHHENVERMSASNGLACPPNSIAAASTETANSNVTIKVSLDDTTDDEESLLSEAAQRMSLDEMPPVPRNSVSNTSQQQQQHQELPQPGQLFAHQSNSDVGGNRHDYDGMDDYDGGANAYEDDDDEREEEEDVFEDKDGTPVKRKGKLLLSQSLCSENTPHRDQTRNGRQQNVRFSSDSSLGHDISIRSASTDSTGVDSPPRPVPPMRRAPAQAMVLQPRELITPVTPEQPGLRRSQRNRIAPVRTWLGERPEYRWSPTHGQVLIGTNNVVVNDANLLRFGTNDPLAIAAQRSEHQAYLRETREQRRREARHRKKKRQAALKRRHKKGQDLDVTVDSIVTSESEQEDEREPVRERDQERHRDRTHSNRH